MKCLPYTLPTTSALQDLEYCNGTDDEQWRCNYNLLNSKIDDCIDDTANSCLIKEYKPTDFQPPTRTTDQNDQNGFTFRIGFWGSKSSADKSREVYKSVFTEYYLLDGYTLIGNIGGTLGLMIGFSFMGAVTFLADLVIGIKAKYYKNKKDQRVRNNPSE